MVRVLFVCLGNICRSPAGEAVLLHKVQTISEGGGPHRGEFASIIKHGIEIDSCGTGGGISDWYKTGRAFHIGDCADDRMMKAAKKRGIRVPSRSRPMTKKDISEFDLIIPMDDANVEAMMEAARFWGGDGLVGELRSKVKKATQFCSSERFAGATEVPDPYYGGRNGFDEVLDMMEDACDGILRHVERHMITATR
eukprot:GHVU01174150.1.p1 GENE.GHVU01174150.1~~GHVU01174150.1.p1  ORF type:complete len:196 (+),score=31.09 GHVU01174150.1:312-899(+)